VVHRPQTRRQPRTMVVNALAIHAVHAGMRARRILIPLGIAIAWCLLDGAYSAAHASAADTLVYCSEGSPESLNPQRMLSGTARNATATTIYDRLVDFRPGTTEIVPALAESWAISADQKTYLFRLRRGVKFHRTAFFTPTRDFNADDVLFSLNRQWRADHPYHRM